MYLFTYFLNSLRSLKHIPGIYIGNLDYKWLRSVTFVTCNHNWVAAQLAKGTELP